MESNNGRGRAGTLLSRFLAFKIDARVIAHPLARIDALVLVALVLTAGALYLGAVLMWGEGTMYLSIGGRWFQSDGWRVFDDMTKFDANHYRDNVHPLFSLTSITATSLIRTVFPVGPEAAIRIFNGIAFMAWCGLLYATMRLIGTRIVDAILLTLLASASAGSLFWFLVPETYIPGTVSIMLCLFVVALATKRDWPFVLAAAGSLSFTVTNWIAGLAAIASSRSIGRGIVLAGLSLGLVLAGWGVGKAIFPQPGGLFLLPSALEGESSFVANKEAGGISHKLAGTLVGPMIAPDLARIGAQASGELLSFQTTGVTSWLSGNILFVLSASAWLLALACSIPALFLRRDRFAVALGLTLLGQVGLHMVYGDETFLYSLHFVPLFALLLAAAMTTVARRAVLPLVVVLLPLALANNVIRLDQAAHEPITGNDPRFEQLLND